MKKDMISHYVLPNCNKDVTEEINNNSNDNSLQTP